MIPTGRPPPRFPQFSVPNRWFISLRWRYPVLSWTAVVYDRTDTLLYFCAPRRPSLQYDDSQCLCYWLH